MTRPTEGRVYRHYKGHTYTVIANAFDEATKAPVVVYRRAHPDEPCVWVRPLASWTESVWVHGECASCTCGWTTVPRFREVPAPEAKP